MTDEEYLVMLPPRIQSVVANALAFEQAQKEQYVERIVNNSRNRFSPEYLMELTTNELEAMADLAAPARQPIFAGAAGGPTMNMEPVDRNDVLVPPTLEFALAGQN